MEPRRSASQASSSSTVCTKNHRFQGSVFPTKQAVESVLVAQVSTQVHTLTHAHAQNLRCCQQATCEVKRGCYLHADEDEEDEPEQEEQDEEGEQQDPPGERRANHEVVALLVSVVPLAPGQPERIWTCFARFVLLQ